MLLPVSASLHSIFLAIHRKRSLLIPIILTFPTMNHTIGLNVKESSEYERLYRKTPKNCKLSGLTLLITSLCEAQI